MTSHPAKVTVTVTVILTYKLHSALLKVVLWFWNIWSIWHFLFEGAAVVWLNAPKNGITQQQFKTTGCVVYQAESTATRVGAWEQEQKAEETKLLVSSNLIVKISHSSVMNNEKSRVIFNQVGQEKLWCLQAILYNRNFNCEDNYCHLWATAIRNKCSHWRVEMNSGSQYA